MSELVLRRGTLIEDGTVYATLEDGRLYIGELDEIVRLAGGPAWTITYSERQKRRHPDLDTSDEGLTVDVVDIVNGMGLDPAFVDALETLPAEPVGDQNVPPRTGLFVGHLVGSLETGVE
jgi:hypothetical protein